MDTSPPPRPTPPAPDAPAAPAAPADYFDREYFELHAGKRRYLDWLLELLHRHSVGNGAVLDVGCGYGFWLSALDRASYRAHGLDVSAQAVARSAEHLPGRVFECSADARYPFADATFDAITMLDVIEHVPDVPAALAECWRCLRPGGALFVITLNSESLAHRLQGRRWCWYQDPTHLHLFSPDSLARVMQDAGFAIESRSTIWNFHVIGETTRWMRPLRALGRVFEWPRFGDSLLYVARRPVSIQSRKTAETFSQE